MKPPLIATQQAKEYTEADGLTDTSRLEKLGWSPRSREDSIKDTVAWLKNYPM